jgi:hypothetical protein
MDEKQSKQEIIRNPDGTFPKGVSGNPAGGGRPAGSFSIRKMIADKMRENPEEAREFIELIYERAKTNNDSKEFKYIEMIVESIDGKLTQPIGGDPNRPIVVVTNIPGLEIKTDTAERADNSV